MLITARKLNLTGSLKKKKYIAPSIKVKNIPNLSDIEAPIKTPQTLCKSTESVHLKLEDGSNIGILSYKFKDKVNHKKEKYLPQDWYTTASDGEKQVKPYLWIYLISIYNENQKFGYGKKLMQQLYKASVDNGCEGRMMAFTAWDSFGFYAKNGWETYLGIDKRVNKTKKKIDILTNIKNKLFKSKETPIVDKILNRYNETLDKLEKRTPYKDEEILFNPTEENLNKLFR